MAEKRYSLRVVLDKATHQALLERAGLLNSTVEEEAYHAIRASLRRRLVRKEDDN